MGVGIFRCGVRCIACIRRRRTSFDNTTCGKSASGPRRTATTCWPGGRFGTSTSGRPDMGDFVQEEYGELSEAAGTAPRAAMSIGLGCGCGGLLAGSGTRPSCGQKDVDDVKEFRQNSAPSTQVEGPTASSAPGCGAVGASRKSAGIAQLVERNLAKVEVASSSLVSRSRFRQGPLGALFLSAVARGHPVRQHRPGCEKRCEKAGVFRVVSVTCTLDFAGIAQLVERNLAKVEVASSSLVSRSKS